MKFPAKLVAGIAGSFLFAGAAAAADIAPIMPPMAAPIVVPVPVASPFAGLYVGNAFGITLGERIFTDAAVVGFNFVNGRRIVGIEGKIGVGPLFTGGGVTPFVAANVHAGLQIGDRAQVYGTAGGGYIVGPGAFFVSGGIGAEVLLGDRLGVFGEARVIQFFVGAPITAQFNFGINWHL